MRKLILTTLATLMVTGAAQAGTLVIDNKTWGVTLRSYPSEHLGEFREHSAEAGQWLRYFSKDEPDRPVDGVDSISVKPFALLGYEWLNFDVPKGNIHKKITYHGSVFGVWTTTDYCNSVCIQGPNPSDTLGIPKENEYGV